MIRYSMRNNSPRYTAASFLGINAVGQGNDWASMVRESLEGMALNPCALFLPAVSIASVMILINRAVDRRGSDEVAGIAGDEIRR